MIFLCGIPSEPSLGTVIEQLSQLSVPHVVFNQRDFGAMEIDFEIKSGRVIGWMQLKGRNYRLEHFEGIYTRLMDYRFLPELENETPNSPKFLYCRTLHRTLSHWFEIAPARVLSRMAEIGSVFSKPYQARRLREHGFSIPETVVTNDPDVVLEFRKKHKKVIYKSISYVRSVVQTLEDRELPRLDHIRSCPIQVQEFVEGTNVRVHTVDDDVFATSISTTATDYRYACLQGEQEELKATKLPPELAEKCVGLSKSFGLELAGIDLKITPDNQVFCFEVNPGPAFSYYEYHTGQPIARAVAKYLAKID